MHLGHTMLRRRLIVAAYQRIHARMRPLFLSQDNAPCISLSSTANVSSTFSPSWTRTAEGVCHLLVISCARSSWTPSSGIYFTSAPRVSWGRTTLCWDPRCAPWLFAGTPAGCKCATLRTGWRALFRGTSAAIMKAWSALSWPMSATCECLSLFVNVFCDRRWTNRHIH